MTFPRSSFRDLSKIGVRDRKDFLNEPRSLRVHFLSAIDSFNLTLTNPQTDLNEEL